MQNLLIFITRVSLLAYGLIIGFAIQDLYAVESQTLQQNHDPLMEVLSEEGNDPGKEVEVNKTQALKLAQVCAEESMQGLGVHGTPLDYERATVDMPAAAKTRGEAGNFAGLGDEFYLVSIPEMPPMNARIPNGLHIIVNLETGQCQIPKMR